MDFEHSPKAAEMQQRLWAFMHEHVFPAEVVYEQQRAVAG
ncbi:MAG: hypothetical protein ACI970_001050, partial [Myxococcota bacterium]